MAAAGPSSEAAAELGAVDGTVAASGVVRNRPFIPPAWASTPTDRRFIELLRKTLPVADRLYERLPVIFVRGQLLLPDGDVEGVELLGADAAEPVEVSLVVAHQQFLKA